MVFYHNYFPVAAMNSDNCTVVSLEKARSRQEPFLFYEFVSHQIPKVKIEKLNFSSNTVLFFCICYSDDTPADPFLVVFDTVTTYQLILGTGEFC